MNEIHRLAGEAEKRGDVMLCYRLTRLHERVVRELEGLGVLVCSFCGTLKPKDDAIEEGWVPSYWQGKDGEEVCKPACVKCTGEQLTLDEGEYITKQ